jgi:hypothetical protein
VFATTVYNAPCSGSDHEKKTVDAIIMDMGRIVLCDDKNIPGFTLKNKENPCQTS